jgi:hypothetical protein
MSKAWIPSIVVVLLAGRVTADEKQPPKPVVPLKVEVVLTRHQGDRKVAKLPYTIICNADDVPQQPGARSGQTVLRMGIEVPVPETKDGKTSAQYRGVGTNLDCSAWALEGGRYKLQMSVEQSSIQPNRQEPSVDAEGRKSVPERVVFSDLPLFRTFRVSFTPVLKDGQTAQYTAATDPVSGEVVKIDVTLNVVK